MNNHKLTFLFLIIFNQIYSQYNLDKNQEKISTALTEYFKLDRENIHLHLNKNNYLTDEEIWLKGYIIDEKTKKPYSVTSNVNIVLLDENGNKILSNLYFAENSTFEGKIKLNEKIKTGTYYIQVFTNYMNNFSEDQSSVFKISIINPSENNYIDSNKINYNKIDINYFPESGIFLEGISNTIGIKISDCNNNGIAVENANVIDNNGNIITNFSTNQFGYGKFDLLLTNNESYKIITEVNGNKIEKILQKPTVKGISLSVNNYTFPNKTILKIKTNQRTFDEIKNEKFTLVIQQNEVASFIDFTFKDKTEQLITIGNEEILKGVNTIYLIDSNLNKIAERSIYAASTISNKLELNCTAVKNDSITIRGVSSIIQGELSISVLPNGGNSENLETSIYNTFLFENNFIADKINTSYFFDGFSRKKHVELDNIFMTKNSKYKWESILQNPPIKNYEFDSGLSIKGTVNTDLKTTSDYKINMNSLSNGLNQTTTLNDKNEFYFENILAIDSTKIHFTLLNKKEKISELKLYSQLLKNNRKFLKPFIPNKTKCDLITDNTYSSFAFPKLKNSIELDSIIINTERKKKKLEYHQRIGNSMSKGYKITDFEIGLYRDLLGFIGGNGFDVVTEGLTVKITSRRVSTLHGSKSPQIFVDDIPETNFEFLSNYKMSSIDEIYINTSGYGGGMDGANGIIKIYTKKGFGSNSGNFKIKSQSLLVKDGFQEISKFSIPKYDGINNDGFKNFGTIHWEPKVLTDENGMFQFSIPNLYQKSVTIIIEGISSDGQMISETKIVDIP